MMMQILNFRTFSCMQKQLLRHISLSTSAVTQEITSTLCTEPVVKDNSEEIPQLEKDKLQKQKRKLVTAAFEKLKTLSDSVEVDDAIVKMITNAKDPEELLSIVKVKKLTRNHALKLVSVLADWTVAGKVQTADFEKDARFAVVCHILGSNPTQVSETKTMQNKLSTDLNTVLGVASDDEAAKLISNISLSQMVKVLSTLASKKRRSTPLLRSLAFNIASSIEKLDIKQGADILYAVASLNYHDEMLVDRVCADLCGCLMANTRRAVVGSIVTSLGLLKHKHTDLLNLLSEWVQTHMDVCTAQDLTSLVMTLAVVHHLPSNQDTLFPVVVRQISTSGVSDPHHWLELVWALTVLKKESFDHLSSVLSADFIDKLRTVHADGLSVPTKLKLLNINGVARLRLKEYNGPLLDLSSEEWKVPLLRSKDKQVLVTAVQETMLNLLPSAVYLGTNIETDMGFIIDGECLVNTKMTPLPLYDKKTKAPIDRTGPDTQRAFKVAILVWDYHDMTRGRRDPTGVNILCQELTLLKGYRIMTVDYLDFNPRLKLVARVQYLSQLLKKAIGQS